jgi:hypothetical protein
MCTSRGTGNVWTRGSNRSKQVHFCRKFAQEARKFADLALATSAAVKQEEEGDEGEEGNGDE